MSLLGRQRHLLFRARPGAARPRRAFLVSAREASDIESLAAVGNSELGARQWTIMLLQTAAEVEHALLVQYLFAGYSLDLGPQGQGLPIPNVQGRTTRSWQGDILRIAREEMGHLLSLQNFLRVLGGPLHFGRDNFPIHTGLYPFSFRLEPLTLTSIARYVAAEMPSPDVIPADVLTAQQLQRIATLTGGSVNRVGLLFQALLDALDELPAETLRSDRDAWQEPAGPWRAGEQSSGSLLGVRVFTVPPGTPAERRQAITDRVRFIANQGESPVMPTTVDSHFERFARIYREFEAAGNFEPALEIATNPNTSADPAPGDVLSPEEQAREQELVGGRIRDEITGRWAHLLNLRYRVLLVALAHSCASGPLARPGDTTPARDVLRNWVFEEMTDAGGSLRDLALILVKRPLGGPSALRAGPPFELSYTLALPDRGPERWQQYPDLFDSSRQLIAELRASSLAAAEQEVLQGILDRDGMDATQGRRAVVASWIGHDQA